MTASVKTIIIFILFLWGVLNFENPQQLTMTTEMRVAGPLIGCGSIGFELVFLLFCAGLFGGGVSDLHQIIYKFVLDVVVFRVGQRPAVLLSRLVEQGFELTLLAFRHVFLSESGHKSHSALGSERHYSGKMPLILKNRHEFRITTIMTSFLYLLYIVTSYLNK